MLLTTAYCPPVSWFAALSKDFTLSADRVCPSMVQLEACENYQKQSWRNRCRIMTAGGVEDLSFPIVHAGSQRISDTRVDYSVPWTQRSCRAIDSAYKHSAYFDYYRDEFYSVFAAKPELLWDLNLGIINFLIEAFGLPVVLKPTEAFVLSAEDDYRGRIHPKKPDTVLSDLGLEKPYFQVFSRKYGFISNLSAIDLLFNEGPNSISYLKRLQ